MKQRPNLMRPLHSQTLMCRIPIWTLLPSHLPYISHALFPNYSTLYHKHFFYPLPYLPIVYKAVVTLEKPPLKQSVVRMCQFPYSITSQSWSHEIITYFLTCHFDSRTPDTQLECLNPPFSHFCYISFAHQLDPLA